MVNFLTHESFSRLMKEIREQYPYAISVDCGKLLNILVRTYAQNRDFVNVLEVGTGVGYSTLWMVKGLIDSGIDGKVYTIESHYERAETTKYQIKKATGVKGLERIRDYVDIIYGNALETIPKLDLDIDFAFIDGVKEEYVKYLESMAARLKRGAMVTAHNVISHQSRMKDFLKEIMNDKKWSSVVVPIDAGLSLSIKKF